MATSRKDAEHKTVIRYCVDRGLTPIQTKKEIESSGMYGNVSRALIYKWHKRFTDGWTDNVTQGRKKKDNLTTIKFVKKVIDEDRRQTVREVAEKTGISKSAIQRILSYDLGMSRVFARWVPRLLSEDEMNTRVAASKQFLARIDRDPDFLNKIITMDETWIHYYEPESKRQSSVWKTPGTPPPKKAKAVKSMDKVMYMVFMDRQGVLLSHAVKHGHSVNAAYYSKVIRRDLLNAIGKKRPAKIEELENVVYHHDNAPAHTAAETNLELDVLGVQRLQHPPYSPDLAPLDFAYFPLLKDHARGRKFTSEEEIRYFVHSFNSSLSKDWFTGVFDKWVERHRKCITRGGHYFEKE
ncbi:hypothetical protein FSP39_021962 [Pinctada imbricata]|uniref:Transposase n=1 Tax=Pinctada imbricata TaxID=66713 RepID=A0AA89BJQ7_PINIB|nr:hypothetical protein FSP39_021962 [Pinctada imbricata]